MNARPNPFRPSAGSDPPLLVGRSGLVEEFAESIEDGPGAPGRASIFTGPRGIGKTVMLNAVSERVQAAYQWRVIDETATTGVLRRLTARCLQWAPPERTGQHVTGVTMGPIGINLSDPATPPELGLRDALGLVLDDLEAHGTGLLITIDEIHAAMREELGQFAAVMQHLVREKREIAVAMAGIPSGVEELLNDRVVTFLRRADRHVLGDVDLEDVSLALDETFRENGRTMSPAGLAAATAATGGYPFMIQLVGYHIWRLATDGTIADAIVGAGIAAARLRLGSLVHATSMQDLSAVDRTFLVVMASDDGPSSVEAIGQRMGKAPNYISMYRSRLIAAGLIRPAGWGKVDYALPFLREYLREHGAHYLVMDGMTTPAE